MQVNSGLSGSGFWTPLLAALGLAPTCVASTTSVSSSSPSVVASIGSQSPALAATLVACVNVPSGEQGARPGGFRV